MARDDTAEGFGHHLSFPAELPLNHVRTLVAEVTAGRFSSAESVDAACWIGGCANAYRHGGVGPFGEGPEDGSRAPETDSELKALAEDIEAQLPEGDSFGTTAVPWTLILPLVMAVLERFLRR